MRRTGGLDTKMDGGTAAVPLPGERNILRIEGDYWTIAFAGQVIRLRDSKGLRYLAQLLWNPGARVSALDLVKNARAQHAAAAAVPATAGDDEAASRERARITVSKGIKAAIQRIGLSHATLAQHLEVTVRRGYACSYNPDPRMPTAWQR